MKRILLILIALLSTEACAGSAQWVDAIWAALRSAPGRQQAWVRLPPESDSELARYLPGRLLRNSRRGSVGLAALKERANALEIYGAINVGTQSENAAAAAAFAERMAMRFRSRAVPGILSISAQSRADGVYRITIETVDGGIDVGRLQSLLQEVVTELDNIRVVRTSVATRAATSRSEMPETIREYAGSFLQRNRGNRQQVARWNQRVLSDLRALPRSTSNQRAVELNEAELRDLYSEVAEHPVANAANLSSGPTYDSSGRWGFCFGRATCAHIEALRRGLAKDQIRKVWAVGTMGDGRWQYHVTTIVRGENGSWYAIDPIMGQHCTIEDWFWNMRANFDDDGRMAMYVSEARRAFPDRNLSYSWSIWSESELRRYFSDLMSSSRQRARPH